MAAPDGRARGGGVSEEVVNGLRVRMKEVDEEIIPLPPARVAEVARLASLPPAAMLAALGASTRGQIQAVEGLLPGPAGRALAGCKWRIGIRRLVRDMAGAFTGRRARSPCGAGSTCRVCLPRP